jgi:hypothetical protein
MVRAFLLPLLLGLHAGAPELASGEPWICSGPEWELRVAREVVGRIPLRCDPGDGSAENFAAFAIERGNRWFERIRDTQGTIDWRAGKIVPRRTLADTLEWSGRLAFVLAQPADTVAAQVIAATRCGDLWAGCLPVRLEGGFRGRFSDLAVPHPRHGAQVRVYIGVPAGRVTPDRVRGIVLLGGKS